MDRLELDTRRVRGCADDLDVLRSEFESAGDIARGAGEAVGSPVLARALEGFADDWSRSRARISESLGSLARTARAIADEFERVDAALACAVPEGTGSAVVAAP